jgi:8-amino-7-oxononanoate synthase
VSLDDEAREELRALEAQHRRRVERVVDGRPGRVLELDGREVLCVASNDYLGLAGDPRLARAACRVLEQCGVGAGASRLIAGNHREHVALEAAIADWLRCGGVRLFSSGYAANAGALAALAQVGDAVFSDELNHASLIDGCKLSRAEVVIYPHRDLVALAALLERSRHRRRLVVSESVFSMDGDFADVQALAWICERAGAALVLDEAHAIGTLGPEGRGLAAAGGVVPDVLIGTCGKALGTAGAFVASTAAVASLLWNRARTFVYSTGQPPAVAAATHAAVEIVRSTEGAGLRRVLAERAAQLRAELPAAGGAPGSAIAPVRLRTDFAAAAVTERLLERGIYAQGIRPPTVPPGTARLRIVVSAALTEADVGRVSREVVDALRQHGESEAR